MARLLYGSGMRLMECVRLRVKDVDFERCEIVVRDGKGGKDRVTVLPIALVDPLRAQLVRMREQHEQALKSGSAACICPTRCSASTRARRREWGWQYVFPGVDAAASIRAAACDAGTTSTSSACSAR